MNKKSQRHANKALSKSTKNKRVHNAVQFTHFSGELQEIIKVWPDLPEHIKAAIKALTQIHIKEQK